MFLSTSFQEIERIFSRDEDSEELEEFCLNDLNCPNSSTVQVRTDKLAAVSEIEVIILVWVWSHQLPLLQPPDQPADDNIKILTSLSGDGGGPQLRDTSVLSLMIVCILDKDEVVSQLKRNHRVGSTGQPALNGKFQLFSPSLKQFCMPQNATHQYIFPGR